MPDIVVRVAFPSSSRERAVASCESKRKFAMPPRSRRTPKAPPVEIHVNTQMPQLAVAAERQHGDLIARRAYELYELRGRQDGHDQDDWYEAERELKAD